MTRDPIYWLLLLVLAVGADVGCVQSGNMIGAAVWSFVALIAGLALVVSRRKLRTWRGDPDISAALEDVQRRAHEVRR
jgi:uncharacterized membrane protein